MVRPKRRRPDTPRCRRISSKRPSINSTSWSSRPADPTRRSPRAQPHDRVGLRTGFPLARAAVMAVGTEPTVRDEPPDLRVRNGVGPTVDRGVRSLALVGGLTVLAILAGIAISTTKRAWPAFRFEGLSYFFSTDWDPLNGHFGAFP